MHYYSEFNHPCGFVPDLTNFNKQLFISELQFSEILRRVIFIFPHIL